MSEVATKKELNKLYVEQDLSDSQIANLLGVHRTYITHLRKVYGIKSNNRSNETGRIGEVYAILKLLSEGFTVQDMNAIDKSHPFDILVDNEIKLDVKSAMISTENSYKYQFANSKANQVKVDSSVIVTQTGRTLKKYHESCHYIVLVALSEEGTQTFIIPSNHHLIKEKQTVSISDLKNNRFNEFRNNWEQLRSDPNDSSQRN